MIEQQPPNVTTSGKRAGLDQVDAKRLIVDVAEDNSNSCLDKTPIDARADVDGKNKPVAWPTLMH